jgi:copper chaperone NosL
MKQSVRTSRILAVVIGGLAIFALILPFASAAEKAGETAPKDDIRQVASCPFCGMDREKFAHSRVFVQYDDGSVLGTCSIHCAAVDQAVKIDKAPVGIWVGDYKSKELIDAEKAVWVLGGNKMGVMSKRAKWAFADKGSAEEFIKADGGKLAGFEEVMKAAFEDMYEDTKMIRERRKAKRAGQMK